MQIELTRPIAITNLVKTGFILSFFLANIYLSGQEYVYPADEIKIVNDSSESFFYFTVDSVRSFSAYSDLISIFMAGNIDSVKSKYSEMSDEYFNRFYFDGGVIDYYDSARVDLFLTEPSEYSIVDFNNCQFRIGAHCSELESCYPDSFAFSKNRNWHSVVLPITILENGKNLQLDRYLTIMWGKESNEVNYISLTNQE